MKKKNTVTTKDKKDWINFTKELANVYDKDKDSTKQYSDTNKIKILDLHGISLDEANKLVKKFIIESSEEGYNKLFIITGKGLRSKVYNNPYLSEQMSVLKYSVPEFIKNDKDLSSKISKISTAPLKDGGEGALCIYLRKRKSLKNKF